MADPLSVAGLAISVVSLGLQVAGGITDYIDALNCRRQDIMSVKQQNDSLRKTLQVIETSLSQFPRDHQDATVAVRECLDLCKQELKALESLVVDFAAYDQPTTGRKDKIKNNGKKLLHPFSRPKLEQLEARLRNANSALQLGLQTLGLSVSQLGTAKLATLEATSHNTSTSLLVVQSEISSMSIPIQGIHSSLSGFETRFDSVENLLKQLLVQQSAINGRPQKIIPAIATGRLIAKPGVLRDICDGVRAQARSTSSEMVPAMNHVRTHFGDTALTCVGRNSVCLCRPRRRLKRKNIVWGSLGFSLETTTEHHLPGCLAAQNIAGKDRSQKIGLTYTGLRHLLNSAVQLSFAMTSGAGGWSLGPTFTYYPTVDSKTAPAFRILSLVVEYSWLRLLNYRLLDEFLPAAVSAILRLLRAKKASPRAVDANNGSLVHYLAKCITNMSHIRWPGQVKPSPLLELLECLLVNKAPANDYDIFGYTPVHHILHVHYIHNPVLTTAVELILQSSAEVNLASLSSVRIFWPPMIYRYSGNSYCYTSFAVERFTLVATSSKIAEACGCGPLSLAILSNNLQEVEQLVRAHPATLAERNLFGHTPLHLAVDKPKCLRVLVQVADTKLLNQTDIPGISALEMALCISGQLHCRAGNTRRRCRRCSCAECVVILLKADCALPLTGGLQLLLSCASQRCRLKYIRHFKDRRDRLKQLALDSLPTMEVERLGLVPGRTLDSFAPHVFQLLQHCYNVQIPDALAVAKPESQYFSPGLSPSSVYQALCEPRDAELFFRLGFHDTDSWHKYDTADLEGVYNDMPRNLSYLHWLAKHGAVSCQLKSFESGRVIFTTHYIFLKISEALLSWMFPRFNNKWSLEFPLATCRAWIHELNAVALPANNADACRCKCSPGGCTPLTSLLKGTHMRSNSMFKLNDEEDRDSLEDNVAQYTAPFLEMITSFTLYLTHFWGDLDIKHHTAALRYLTYTVLRIPHYCCDPYSNPGLYSVEGSENIEDIEEIYEYELELLEVLLVKFESELIAILQDPGLGIADLIDFWKQTWVGRMEAVVGNLQGSDLTDDERRGAEEIGVVWDNMGPKPPEATGSPYDETLDYWTYELAKIEAECW